jgi:ABC-type siderophore export system fused ATPase/permease subunit
MEIKKQKPPGKKLLKNMTNRTKWLIAAPLGLAMVGYGLCVFSEAGNIKHTGGDFQKWFLLGTYSLVMINAGLSIFGQAVIFKIRSEMRKNIKKVLKERQQKLQNQKPLSPTKMPTQQSI